MSKRDIGFGMRLKIRFLGEANALGLAHERVESYDGIDDPGVYVDSKTSGHSFCTASRLLDPERDIPKLKTHGISYIVVGPYPQLAAKQEP